MPQIFIAAPNTLSRATIFGAILRARALAWMAMEKIQHYPHNLSRCAQAGSR